LETNEETVTFPAIPTFRLDQNAGRGWTSRFIEVRVAGHGYSCL